MSNIISSPVGGKLHEVLVHTETVALRTEFK